MITTEINAVVRLSRAIVDAEGQGLRYQSFPAAAPPKVSSTAMLTKARNEIRTMVNFYIRSNRLPRRSASN